MIIQQLAVVLPAYNEAEGLPGFLAEISEAVAPVALSVTVVVVDDRSTDGTADAVGALAVGNTIKIVTNDVNRGHGPTALRAYRAGLATGADVVLHVDGDGQFIATEISELLKRLSGHDGVRGVRRFRGDPWFRRALTRAVYLVTFLLARRRVPDVNSPLRAYRREALEQLLKAVPSDSVIPHVHFSINERRCGLSVATVGVRSIPRRGGDPSGTMWGSGARFTWMPPRRLRRFVRRAAWELLTYRVRLSWHTTAAKRSPMAPVDER